MPKDVSFITKDVEELNALWPHVIRFTEEGEKLLKSESFELFIDKENELEHLRTTFERLKYLQDLSEDLIYDRMLPALKLPPRSGDYPNFTQEHRDIH